VGRKLLLVLLFFALLLLLPCLSYCAAPSQPDDATLLSSTAAD
jgi:outer membrane lipoprotein-sorting protein